MNRRVIAAGLLGSIAVYGIGCAPTVTCGEGLVLVGNECRLPPDAGDGETSVDATRANDAGTVGDGAPIDTAVVATDAATVDAPPALDVAPVYDAGPPDSPPIATGDQLRLAHATWNVGRGLMFCLQSEVSILHADGTTTPVAPNDPGLALAVGTEGLTVSVEPGDCTASGLGLIGTAVGGSAVTVSYTHDGQTLRTVGRVEVAAASLTLDAVVQDTSVLEMVLGYPLPGRVIYSLYGTPSGLGLPVERFLRVDAADATVASVTRVEGTHRWLYTGLRLGSTTATLVYAPPGVTPVSAPFARELVVTADTTPAIVFATDVWHPGTQQTAYEGLDRSTPWIATGTCFRPELLLGWVDPSHTPTGTAGRWSGAETVWTVARGALAAGSTAGEFCATAPGEITLHGCAGSLCNDIDAALLDPAGPNRLDVTPDAASVTATRYDRARFGYSLEVCASSHATMNSGTAAWDVTGSALLGTRVDILDASGSICQLDLDNERLPARCYRDTFPCPRSSDPNAILPAGTYALRTLDSYGAGRGSGQTTLVVP